MQVLHRVQVRMWGVCCAPYSFPIYKVKMHVVPSLLHLQQTLFQEVPSSFFPLRVSIFYSLPSQFALSLSLSLLVWYISHNNFSSYFLLLLITLTYVKIDDIMCIFKIFDEYSMFRGQVSPPQFFQFIFLLLDIILTL